MSHGRHNRVRDIGFFYPSASHTGYNEVKSRRRFAVLDGIPDLGSSTLLHILAERSSISIKEHHGRGHFVNVA